MEDWVGVWKRIANYNCTSRTIKEEEFKRLEQDTLDGRQCRPMEELKQNKV